MKLDELQKKLLAAAKANPPADRVPLAFEKRVLANLAAQSVPDVSALWARALWRAVIPCVAVTLVLAAFSFVPANNAEVTGDEDLSQVFEQTLLASSEQLEETW